MIELPRNSQSCRSRGCLPTLDADTSEEVVRNEFHVFKSNSIVVERLIIGGEVSVLEEQLGTLANASRYTEDTLISECRTVHIQNRAAICNIIQIGESHTTANTNVAVDASVRIQID